MTNDELRAEALRLYDLVYSAAAVGALIRNGGDFNMARADLAGRDDAATQLPWFDHVTSEECGG
jgi:Arc/MetJ family transcription regulator